MMVVMYRNIHRPYYVSARAYNCHSNRHARCHLYIERTDSMICKLKVSHFVHIDSTALDGLRPLIKLASLIAQGPLQGFKKQANRCPHTQIHQEELTHTHSNYVIYSL